jgi:hypothetical protein
MIETRLLREAQLAEIEECATPSESLALLLASAELLGWPRVRLGQRDPEPLAQLVARIRLRAALDLPQRDCFASEKGVCLCLSRALDLFEAAEAPTREAIVEAALGQHRDPKPSPGPYSGDSLGGAQSLSEGTRAEEWTEGPDPPARAFPARDRDITKPGRFRPIKRRPKWYDPHPGDIRSMEF